MATGALIGALRVTLGLDSAAFEKGANQMSAKLAGVSKSFSSAGQKLAVAGAAMTVAVTAPFVALIAKSIPAAIESQQAIAQVNAALASMGPVSGRTSAQLTQLAGHLQDISLFDDDDILKSVTANLLTFGQVSGTVFDRAQQAIVDYSARTGRDLQATTIMIGKALQDPVKGVTALQKAGVKLTDQQKEQVKAMMAVGNVAGAQAIVLGELEREYKGSAKAQRDATPGADVQQQWRTFQETIGAIALKFLPPLNAALAGALAWFNKLSPGMQDVTIGVAAFAAAIGPVMTVIGGISSLIGLLLPLLGEAGLAGLLGGVGIAAAPVVAVVAGLAAAWVLFGDSVRPVLSDLWTQMQPLWQMILDGAAQVGAALTELWASPFGTGLKAVIGFLGDFLAMLLQVFGSAAIAVIKSFVQVTTAVFANVLSALKGVGQFLSGDFSGAWNTVKAMWTRTINALGQVIENFAPGAVNAIKNMVIGIGHWMYDKMNAIWDWAGKKIQWIADKFKWLADVVVFHSYIPDMVDLIGQHIARLQGLMVTPAERMTKKTADAFAALNERVAGTLAELFPDEKQLADIAGKIQDLEDKIKLDPANVDLYREAIARLHAEADKLRGAIAARPANGIAPNADGPLTTIDAVDALASGAMDAAEAAVEASKAHVAANDNILASYSEMAQGVAEALQTLVGDIKSGDWLSVLEDVVKLLAGGLMQFSGGGGGGGFGGARAAGGPVRSGRTYLVGERGPELFTPNGSGSIISNRAMRASGGASVVHVHVVANDYFDAKVGNISGNAAVTVASEGQRRVSRSSSQSLLRR
jgi:hypothetical protein